MAEKAQEREDARGGRQGAGASYDPAGVTGSFGIPDPHEGDHGGPLGLKLVLFFLSLILTLLGSEVVVRLADGGALLQYNAFTVGADGIFALSPSTSRRLRTPGGDLYSIHTGPLSLRQAAPDAPPPPEGAWLILGDSQVLGMGVEAEESFPFQLGAMGIPAVGAGVLGFGIRDSVARAESLLPRLKPRGVVVVYNQINDWEDGLTFATERFKVRGGFAVTARRADSLPALILQSPLGRLHLVDYALQLVFNADVRERDVPPLTEDGERLTGTTPDGPMARAIGDTLRTFAAQHPGLPVVAAFLPADYATSPQRAKESPFANEVAHVSPSPWTDTRHRDALARALGPVPLVDLLPVLKDQPDAFLTLDYHLSADGHRRVAEALAGALPAIEAGAASAPTEELP